MASAERRAVWFGLTLVLVGACAHNQSPPGFLPDPEAGGNSLRGGWIELDLGDTTVAKQAVMGELLAASAESLWVQPLNGSGVVVPRRYVAGSSRLTRYKATTSRITAGTIAGVVSTVTNGFILIITAPIWAITGTAAGAADTEAAQTAPFPSTETDAMLRAFSRYPLGMPPGADRAFARWSPRGAR